MSRDPRAGPSHPVTRVAHAIASIALTVMMLVVAADVVLRHTFGIPVRGAYDMVGIALLVMVFFGTGPVIARRGEILIDLVDGLLPPGVLRGLRTVAAVGTLTVFVFLAYAMIGPARDAWRYDDRSLELGIPVWMLWAAAFMGLACILFASVCAILAAFRGAAETPTARRKDGVA